VGSGILLVADYTVRPGAVGHIATQWSPAQSLHLDNERLTVLMAVHPKCVCTGASVDELARLVANANGRVAVTALLLVPHGTDGTWRDAPIRDAVARIPDVAVIEDHGGVIAASLGARTSGHVFVYAPDGLLKFHGGITASRGHRGDNVGRSTIEALANRTETSRTTTPVFGCELFASAAIEQVDACDACQVK